MDLWLNSSMTLSSFYVTPTPGVPEGVNGIIHALRMFHSTYGVTVDSTSIAAIRSAAADGLDLSLIVDLRTFGDGRIHRLRYNVPGKDSGSYIDSDGVSVHVDSEAYDFEFAVSLGIPEDVRVYATSRYGSKSMGSAKRLPIVVDGSEIVGKGNVYRIFLSQEDVDPTWIEAAMSGRVDFFLDLKRRKSSGSASNRPIVTEAYRRKLESYGWDKDKIDRLEKKAAESKKPSVYVKRSVDHAGVDAHRRRLADAKREQAAKRFSEEEQQKNEMYSSLLDEASRLFVLIEERHGKVESVNVEMAINRKLLGYSDDELVTLGYPGASKMAREKRISRGVEALLLAGASKNLAKLMKSRSYDTTGSWELFYRNHKNSNGSSGALPSSALVTMGISALAGAAAVRLLRR